MQAQSPVFCQNTGLSVTQNGFQSNKDQRQGALTKYQLRKTLSVSCCPSRLCVSV